MPDLSFQFSGQIFTLKPSDYLLYNYIVGIQSMDMGSNPGAQSSDLVVLGDPFLRAVYTIFDMDNARVGFANARAPQPITDTSNYGGNSWTNWLESVMDSVWAWPPFMYFLGTAGVVLLAAYLCVGGWCNDGNHPNAHGTGFNSPMSANGENTPLYPPPPAVLAQQRRSGILSSGGSGGGRTPMSAPPVPSGGVPGHIASTYHRSDNSHLYRSHDYGSVSV
jgi:hypothetical protein